MDRFNKERMRNEFLIEVGNTIKNNRNKKKISQEKLAIYLEVDRSSISKYENGRMDMPVSNLPLISHYCDFPISDFVRASRVKASVSQLDYLVGVYTGNKGVLDRRMDEDLKNARQELEQSLLKEGNEAVMNYIIASKEVADSMEQLDFGQEERDYLIGIILISLVKGRREVSGHLKKYVEALTGGKWE